MTTPGAPGEVGQDAPRHARARRTSRAAALDRAAAPAARQPRVRAARQPRQPQTFAQQRTATRARQRARLASRGASFTPEGAALAGADIGVRAARDAGRARLPGGDRQYQGVILAEFLVAVLIVALAPLARGKAAQDQSSGPSPYGVDDVKQLVGIGAVYFVLALLSSGKWGRYSAWFGGLVLVAIGLAQTTSGGLPAIFAIFQPSSKSAGPPSDSGQLAGVPLGFLPENGPLPTPTGAPTFDQSVVSGGAVSSVAFTQPGVIVNDQGNVQVNP